MESKYDNRFKSIFEAIKLLIQNYQQFNQKISYEDTKQKNKKFGFVSQLAKAIYQGIVRYKTEPR